MGICQELGIESLLTSGYRLQEVTHFDDLDAEEQNACVLLDDLILAAVCLVLAAIL